MIIAFIPCRLKSTRLPEKAIKEIYGISAIERCLINAKAIPGIDRVILATSTNKEDDVLERYNLNDEIEICRGSENDVLDRFMPIIKKYNPDHIIRITGDCPLVSAELGEFIINSHIARQSDATFTLSKVALGITFEIYKTTAIYRLKELLPETTYSEYLIYYFQNNPNLFSLNIIEAPEKFIKNWRLTLDEENDLQLFNLIYRTLNIGKRAVSFDEIISFFEVYPEAVKINQSNIVKYRDNKELVAILKNATTLK